MASFEDVPPPPLEEAPLEVIKDPNQILRRGTSSGSNFGGSFYDEQRARASSSGKNLLMRALSGNDSPTAFAWGNVNEHLDDYEQVFHPVKKVFELREKQTGKVLREPPKDWGWDNKWSRCQKPAAQQFSETVRDEVIDFLVKHLPSKIHLIDDLLDKWEGQEDKLFKFLEEDFGQGDSVIPGQTAAMKPEDKEDFIFNKLTNPKLYTGASRHRFDSKGIGRGAEGRDRVRKGGGGVGFSSFKGNSNDKSEEQVGPLNAVDFLNRKWS
ncbi:hypothetical protein TL16_g11976 [Triparma laevis f. inornata]|uniref:Uncharacterized protein n=1 Tax=Triparma laevis f. inornata TaxID=1714386 RepID=A0A9W7BI73_9STRA|nr:hypothetical protein TL16_g11976 [Triparma laevis f. inornata]